MNIPIETTLMFPYKNPHDPLNYNMVDGVKIYTGTTHSSAITLDKRISKYKAQLNDNKIFTELIPSTLTAKGSFNGVVFNEEEIIDMLTTPVGGHIIQIGCNYGVIKNPSPCYTPPVVKKRVSKRGRKPKAKPKTKRKLQGSGKFFSSQITFEIYNPDTDKVIKIKLFRNGGFQVPGIKKPDMTDLIKPIRVLRDYLRKEFVDDTIKVQYFISVMRNYICKINKPTLLFKIIELEKLLKAQKTSTDINPICEFVNNSFPNIIQPIKDVINEYIGKKKNEIGIAEIQNNCERYFGLILKFYRPMPWNLNKRSTIKVLRSGKVNFDGCNSVAEAEELYYWLECICDKYPIVFHDTEKIESDHSSDSYELSSGCESIYDEDLISDTDST
jgi:hypothetical protein